MTIAEAPCSDNPTNQSPLSPPLSSKEIHTTKSSLVSSAQYPIPQPLSSILRAVLTKGSESTSSSCRVEKKTSLECIKFVKESMEDSLENLIRNCFVAVDDMYFAM